MKTIFKSFVFILLFITVGSITSCTKKFEELNTNPNTLAEVAPGTLLAPAQFEGMWLITKRAHRLNNELMQYTVETGTLNDFSRYEFKENEFDAIWQNLYRRANDMNEMYLLAERINDVNNMGAALVMKAWFVSNLTDMFGDIPYTEAFQGKKEMFYPRFDSQKDIYVSILADLKRANDLFTETKPFVATDLIYSNDPVKWKKFANSMHLRLLLRVSNKTEMNAPAQIADIFGNPAKYPLILTNDDEAMMRYTGVSPFVNLFYDMSGAEFSGAKRMGKPLMDLMNTTVDGRRFRYSTKNTGAAYSGIPSGYTEQETIVFAQNNGSGSSTLATTLKGVSYPFPILTSAEVNFCLSEAALKTWITADAQAYYNKGIECSWRQWNCTWDGTAGTNYLNRSAVKFAGATATMDRLMSQKYIAMFFSGFEAWYDYRRTGLPVLPIGPAVQNAGTIPVRFEYPLVVKATNKANYEAAVSKMGADNLSTKVWWQQ